MATNYTGFKKVSSISVLISAQKYRYRQKPISVEPEFEMLLDALRFISG